MRTLTTIVCDVSVDFDINGAMIEESGLEAGGTTPELDRPHHQWLWAADQCWVGGAKAKLDIVGSVTIRSLPMLSSERRDSSLLFRQTVRVWWR